MTMRATPLSSLVAALAVAAATLLPSSAVAQDSRQVAAPLPLATIATPAPGYGALAEQATLIARLLAQGQGADAVRAARALSQWVATQAGFGVLNTTLTQGEATGYGVYVPRADNVYSVGEAVRAYVELYGYTVEPTRSGAHRLTFDLAFTVTGPDGTPMIDDYVSMGDVVIGTHSVPQDGYLALTYRITGLEGAAMIRTRITDRASGASTEFSLPVVFAPPAETMGSKRLPRDDAPEAGR